MFHLVGQIFSGLIIGTLANLVMPSRNPGGVIATALIGLAGSALGTTLVRIFAGVHLWLGWLLSIFSAVVTLAIYRFAIGNRPRYRQGLINQQ